MNRVALIVGFVLVFGSLATTDAHAELLATRLADHCASNNTRSQLVCLSWINGFQAGRTDECAKQESARQISKWLVIEYSLNQPINVPVATKLDPTPATHLMDQVLINRLGCWPGGKQ